MDAKADLLVYGNAEERLSILRIGAARGEHLSEIRDLRGTAAVLLKQLPEGWSFRIAAPLIRLAIST